MRRLGDSRALAGGLFQRQKAVGENLELLLEPVDLLPLKGQLLGQFVYGLRLIGEGFFQLYDARVTHGIFRHLLKNGHVRPDCPCYSPPMIDSEPLSSEEIERYARHIVLPEIGGAGQQALKRARVLVIGAGGLGSPVLAYLAAAGVGMLGIADDDGVSLSNLQRQVIHDSGTIGAMKTESAARAIARINPHVIVKRHDARLDDGNIDAMLKGYDILMDGSDNFDTRYLAADAAERAEIPLVTGAVGRFDGSLTVLCPHRHDADGKPNPRYRDLYPKQPPAGLVPSCAEAGVIGPVTGVIGTLMAMEAIKLITGAGEPLIGRLLLYDGLGARFETIRYKRKSRPV